MNFLLRRYNYFILLILVFVVSEVIVNPIGDFPLNDDWSYGKAIYYTLLGDFTVGTFGAMTLFTHIMWGAMFVKIFGFTFTVLRMSTLFSAITGIFFLEKIIFKITQNKLLGFIACLVLLFNPLYFNLSNTFMTDVNFNTLLTICCFCAYCFFETKRNVYLFLFFGSALFLVLLRQYGLIAPVGFTFTCLVSKEQKRITVLISIVGTLFIFTLLKAYENYLSGVLPVSSTYKFSGNIPFSDISFYKWSVKNFLHRYRMILLHVLFYTVPFALLFLPSLVKEIKKSSLVVAVLVNFFFVTLLFYSVDFPFLNIFMNMNLGPETFYQSSPAQNHTYSVGFGIIMKISKYLFSGISLLTLSLYALKISKKIRKLKFSSEVIFLFFLIIAYGAMLVITDSYFDRYHIPFITLSLILFAYFNKDYAINCKFALLPIVCFFYVSVFGTKDYLTLNRVRWEAYDYLKKTRHTNAEHVNGGFEINCYNDLKKDWWQNYTKLDRYTYLIQFRKEDGFVLLKEYPFQRYFPYKKDQINIYFREK